MHRLSTLAASLLATTGLAAVDTYTGTYQWLDLPAEEYKGKTLSLTLEPADEGYQASLSAQFQTKHFEGHFTEMKSYEYQGTLAKDAETGMLSGTISSADGKKNWQVEVKIHEGRAVGIAKEATGYRTWATFAVAKAAEAGD